MKTIKSIIEIEEYDSLNELSEEDKQLLLLARQAASRAYAPYSNFKVGAAIQMGNGNVVEGSNQENSSYPVGSCAERTALFFTSSQYPGEKILSIAIASQAENMDNSRPLSPCGMCRQALLEYEIFQKSPIRVLMGSENGRIWIAPSATSLLPLHFDHQYLLPRKK
jgi:cytidine deaminase